MDYAKLCINIRISIAHRGRKSWLSVYIYIPMSSFLKIGPQENVLLVIL